MSLGDRDILEMNELCCAAVDETLDDRQRARLQELLAGSEEARRFYVRAMGLSASLCHHSAEMQLEAPDRAQWRLIGLGAAGWGAILAAAACIAAIAYFAMMPRRAEVADLKSGELVATLTGAKACQWSGASPELQLGEHLRKGQRLDLTSGYAEVTFDSGAQVVLEGPASFVLNSPWDGTLRSGGLKAYVPPEALGFRVSHPSVEVVDLGTEFAMVADATGAADVIVLKGEVEAAPRDPADQDAIVLREKESRRFAKSGVSPVPPEDSSAPWLDEVQSFDRFPSTARYAHWPLGRLHDGKLPGQAFGLPAANYDLTLSDVADLSRAIGGPDGSRRHALRFDGRMYAQAAFPGISDNSTRTVAFWVKVPADSPLSDAYSMVAWSTTGRKLGSRPVQITWNRISAEGPIGALRTDFRGGSALGHTSLRDGRWHHVAVVFAPGEDEMAPVQVRQYLDGKLESAEVNPPRRSAPLASSKTVTPAILKDTLWLGCRLGTGGQRSERFRGEIDELFVAGWGLEPSEIVQVMRNNRLVSEAFAADFP